MERLAAFDAGAAAAAMQVAALVAGPRLGEGRAVLGALGDDRGFRRVHEGGVEAHIGIAVQRLFLHRVEGLGKGRAAIGVDEVVAAMHCGGHRVGLLRRSQAEGHGEHDGVAVRHDGRLHRLFGIMAVRHLDIVSQRRARQMRADRAHVDQVERHAEPVGRGPREVQLLGMALAVIEGNQSRELVLGGDLVGERHGVEPARADHIGFHLIRPCFDRVGCDRCPDHSGRPRLTHPGGTGKISLRARFREAPPAKPRRWRPTARASHHAG